MRTVTIGVKDYQSIEKTLLSFGPGLTVITGSSNSGKSALFRAVYSAIMNPSASKHHIRDDAKEAVVFIHIEGYPKVTWRRKRHTVVYEVDGEKFIKAGRSTIWDVCPSFPLRKEDSGLLINFHREVDTLFPFGLSTQDLFKQFEQVMSIDDSATVLKSLKRQQIDSERFGVLLGDSIAQTKSTIATMTNLVHSITAADATNHASDYVASAKELNSCNDRIQGTVSTPPFLDHDQDKDTLTEYPILDFSGGGIGPGSESKDISLPSLEGKVELSSEGTEVPEDGCLGRRKQISEIGGYRSLGEEIPRSSAADRKDETETGGHRNSDPAVQQDRLSIEAAVEVLTEYVGACGPLQREITALESLVPRFQRGTLKAAALSEALQGLEKLYTAQDSLNTEIVAHAASCEALDALERSAALLRSLPSELPSVDGALFQERAGVTEDYSNILNLLDTYANLHDSVTKGEERLAALEAELSEFNTCPLCERPWEEAHGHESPSTSSNATRTAPDRFLGFEWLQRCVSGLKMIQEPYRALLAFIAPIRHSALIQGNAFSLT